MIRDKNDKNYVVEYAILKNMQILCWKNSRRKLGYKLFGI